MNHKMECTWNKNLASKWVVVITCIVSLPDAPDGVLLQPPDDQTVLEGEPITPVQCTAECNPQCTYIWTGPDGSVTKEESEDGLLEIEEIHRIQDGEHSCEAGNSVSSQTESLTITVHYPPDVNLSPQSATEGDTVTMTCTADSNPHSTFSWSNVTENSDGLDGDIESSEAESTLTIQNAQCQKQSQIQCSADNEVQGSPRAKVAELDVKCKHLFTLVPQ